MRKLALAIAFGLPIAPIQAHAATDAFKFSLAEGSVSGSFSDSCSSGSFFLSASAGGEKNNVKFATPVAFASIFVFNQCTSSFSCEAGSANNIQFSIPPGTTGNQVPKSVTASGTISLQDFCDSAPPDSLTFNMALTANGFVFQLLQNFRQTFTLVKKPTVMFDEHRDFNESVATGSLTISTTNLGTLPTSNASVFVDDGRQHSVSITH